MYKQLHEYVHLEIQPKMVFKYLYKTYEAILIIVLQSLKVTSQINLIEPIMYHKNCILHTLLRLSCLLLTKLDFTGAGGRVNSSVLLTL